MVQGVLRRLQEARRHHHLRHALQREAVELCGGSQRRDGRRAGGALPRQLPGRRRDHRARLDLAAAAPQKFLLNDGMNSTDFIDGRRRAVSRTTPTAPRRAPARPPRPSTSTPTTRPSRAASSRTPRRPTAPMTPAPSWRSPSPRPARAMPPRSRRRSRKVVAAGGEPIHAGKEEFAKALGADQGRQADQVRGRHRPGQLRPVWRHHRPVPPVADQGRRSDDGRRDERRRGREGQGRAREPEVEIKTELARGRVRDGRLRPAA